MAKVGFGNGRSRNGNLGWSASVWGRGSFPAAVMADAWLSAILWASGACLRSFAFGRFGEGDIRSSISPTGQFQVFLTDVDIDVEFGSAGLALSCSSMIVLAITSEALEFEILFFSRNSSRRRLLRLCRELSLLAGDAGEQGFSGAGAAAWCFQRMFSTSPWAVRLQCHSGSARPSSRRRAAASSGGRLTNTITTQEFLGLGRCFNEFRGAPNLAPRRSAPFLLLT